MNISNKIEIVQLKIEKIEIDKKINSIKNKSNRIECDRCHLILLDNISNLMQKISKLMSTHEYTAELRKK